MDFCHKGFDSRRPRVSTMVLSKINTYGVWEIAMATMRPQNQCSGVKQLVAWSLGIPHGDNSFHD